MSPGHIVIRILAAVAAALTFATASAAAVDYKIGFVNTERLFREAAPAKRAQQKLEREFSTRDAEIQKLAKQVRDLQAVLDRDGATMSDGDRRNKERDLANGSRDLARLQREFREDVNLRKNEELASLQDPVVFASQRIDITERVIKALADK